MSFSANKTYELWKSFMPDRRNIERRVGSELYSIEIYPENFFDSFDPEAGFQKWAAVEVPADCRLPGGMELLKVPAGLYAVFVHRGPSSEGEATYRYIFGTWLPHSGYLLDARPHFAVMGESYRSDDPSSEEELWIPVRKANPRSPGGRT